MTRDKVIELARKVKLEVAFDFDYRGSFEAMTAPEQDKLVQLEQFAALIAAAECEALYQAIKSVGECGCREWCGCFTPETALSIIRARATTPKKG